jgi:hypothetical protein
MYNHRNYILRIYGGENPPIGRKEVLLHHCLYP